MERGGETEMSDPVKREEHLSRQLLEGLQTLADGIQKIRQLHVAQGLDISSFYTKSTEDMLKIHYADTALKMLELDK
jgi:hypothetical protein